MTGKRLLIASLLLLSIGFLSGWMSFLLFGDIAKFCRVLFISGEAIIKAEEARVKTSKDGERRLFFGQTDQAIKLMEKTATGLEDRWTKVLIVSGASGAARGGEAVSEEVHARIVEALKQENKTQDRSAVQE